ncbi:hypothetical protein J31TS4_10380 [Paenibacillus sp. J31TS4]|nr:hypothetical protein J31TS4_10380 [Paenibacillus sp. J31TS4]
MIVLLIVIVTVGMAGIIGNQYAALRRLEAIEKTLQDMQTKKET